MSDTEERKPYPLCKDCQHYLIGRFCNRERDLIEGKPVDCAYMRSNQGGCQQPGYLFEPRDAEPKMDLQPECTDPDLSPSCPCCNASNTWRWSRHYQCCSCNHRWE